MTAGRAWTFVVARRFGRLANRLAVFAHLIAFAESRGCSIINPTFHSYSDNFANLADNFYCAYPRPTRPSLFDRVPFVGDAVRSVRGLHHLTEISAAIARYGIVPGAVVVDKLDEKQWPATTGATRRPSIVFMRDWHFRVPDLVMQYADTVRSFLRPTDLVAARSDAAAGQLREQADLVVGVHIRHGDYETFRGGAYFFTVGQYAAWMHELAEIHAPRRVAFLVCSDGNIDRSAFAGLVVGFGPGDPFGDIFALTACDLLIGPVSTFTQWSSYYGNVPLYQLHHAADRPKPGQFAVSNLCEFP